MKKLYYMYTLIIMIYFIQCDWGQIKMSHVMLKRRKQKITTVGSTTIKGRYFYICIRILQIYSYTYI